MTRHPRRRGRPCRRAEDRACAADVRVHACLGDTEEPGDLLRREAARDGAQDLTLTIRQRADRPGTARENPPRQHIAGNDPDDHRSGALHRER